MIAIISILAAILIPNFMHARAESVTSACEMNEKMLATAEEEYSVDNGGLYIAIASLTTPYLSANLTDPVKKGNTYSINTDGRDLRLVSNFRFGRPRLNDDDASYPRWIVCQLHVVHVRSVGSEFGRPRKVARTPRTWTRCPPSSIRQSQAFSGF